MLYVSSRRDAVRVAAGARLEFTELSDLRWVTVLEARMFTHPHFQVAVPRGGLEAQRLWEEFEFQWADWGTCVQQVDRVVLHPGAEVYVLEMVEHQTEQCFRLYHGHVVRD